MEAYSDKLRELVLECYEEGLETAVIAKRFKVSCDWVRRVRRRWLEDEIRTVIKQKHGPDPLMDEDYLGERDALMKKAQALIDLRYPVK